MRDSAKQIQDLLLLVSYVNDREDGAPVDEVCEKLGVPRDELLRYVDTLLLCGKPPFSPDDFILIVVENDRIYVDIDQQLGRPVRLTAQEGLAISVALRTISGSGPYADTARSALSKIKEHLADDIAELVREMEHRITMEGGERGAEDRLAALRNGLQDRCEVAITYFSVSSQKVTERKIRPYLLAQNAGFWYVVAYDSLREDERIFKVERIREARVTDEHFELPEDFDSDPFESGRVFMPGQDLTSARISIRGAAGRAVADTLPPDDVIESSADRVVVQMHYANLEWMAAWVVSFGDAADVLNPPELRSAVAQRSRAILDLY